MPNLVTAPRFWKNKAILIDDEVSYATDVVPTGAANWIEARNVSLMPFDAETQERAIDLPYMGHAGRTVVARWAKLSFEFLASGGGAAGTIPKYSPLMMGCGFAETNTPGTSTAYNLVSTGHKSLTAYVNIDGVVHKFVGARGDLRVRMSAKAIPVIAVELTCLYVAPVTQALPAVTRTGWQIDEGVNAANTSKLTLNAVDLAFSGLEAAVGNQIARISLPGPQLAVEITDRKPTGSLTVLAPALATFDPFALADAGTNVALSVTHGSAAGRKLKLDMKVVVVGAEYERIDEMVAYKLALEPTPVSGNDEIVVTAL